VSDRSPGSARGLVIAIDGPSGAGKSTAGRALAARLGYTYIDTGAMYRALALKALQRGVSTADEAGLVALSAGTEIALEEGGSVVLDGQDVTLEIRSRPVSVAASQVSQHPGVRRDMVARQRRLGAHGGVVLDGRDIGTAVFPDAEVKFYVDADPAERALRRHAEMAAAGNDVSLDVLEREIRQRDDADRHRAESPLVCASDAVRLDTTSLGPAEVIERMSAVVSSVRSSR
jgi:cytidylate kinase